MRKLVVASTVVAALVAAGLMALAWWLRASGLPSRGGTHVIAGLHGPVTVRWDRWAVPHLSASHEEDLAAALGYLHANDRFTQMELGRRAAFGRLSELLGEATVGTDLYFRRLGVPRAAEALIEQVEPRSRSWLEAYARGVDAWLAERGTDLPPELRILGAAPEPWRAVDSLAFAFLMARDLSFWNERPEEERFLWLSAFGAEGVRELVGDPDLHVPEALLDLAAATGSRAVPAEGASGRSVGGSNNWAVGGGRASSGQPMVANDPHLGLHLPGTWYQALLRSPTFEVAGMTLPGIPAVVIGRGRHVAWGFTNTMLDDHDLFFEELDSSGEHYRRGDRWLPIEVTVESLRVRGQPDRRVELRRTERGPLLEADRDRGLPPRSLAWTMVEGGDSLAALQRLAVATTVEEVLAGTESYVCPAQNLAAALADGGLVATVLGRLPARRRGDGRLPSPGWDESYGWDGLLPRSDNPTIVGDDDGVLVTANDGWWPAAPDDPWSVDLRTSARADRIRERLVAHRSWDAEGFSELQSDVVSLYGAEIVDLLEEPYEGDARAAYAVLRSWDGSMHERGPAALYQLTYRHLVEAIFGDESVRHGLALIADRAMLRRVLRGEARSVWFDDVRTPTTESRRTILQRALAAAWREGVERFGEDAGSWPYGELHRLTLRHRLDALPIIGRWLRRGPFPMAGSATTVAAFGGRWRGGDYPVVFGPSMRWVVDHGRPDSAWSVLPGGQSGHGADPHYDDQLALYLAGRLHPAPWTEGAIAAATVGEMRLVPEGAADPGR